MDAQHRDSNPGSAEVSKRALLASAGKETQTEHAQNTKVSAVMASVDPKALFRGKPAGSVHAPPVEAVLTTTSNEKDSPPRLSPANTTDQQSAQQHATVPPSRHWFRRGSCTATKSRTAAASTETGYHIKYHPAIKLHSSTLRRLQLLERIPSRNPPHKNKTMCGHPTTNQTTKSVAMAPLTR